MVLPTSFFYRSRSRFWRNNRILFPSPAEVQFIRLMGGKVIQVDHFKHPKTGFPFTIVTSMGKYLEDEKFKREVRVGKYWIDFGNDICWGIEVDGEKYHKDIVFQQDRDDYFADFGWRVLHIPAIKIWVAPNEVQRAVLKFLTT